MRNMRRFFFKSSVLLLITVVVGWETPMAHADNITVTSTNDSFADDGLCTLREAIHVANTDTAISETQGECPAGSGADTVTLAADATYALTSATSDGGDCTNLGIALCVIDEVTIEGNGATIMRAGGNIGVFFSFGSLTVNDATISGGRGIGGITVGGELELNDSVVSGNESSFTSGLGGGITNFGITVLNNSTVKQNTYDKSGDIGGGGIHNRHGAMLILNNSTVSGNTLTSSGGGTGAGGISSSSGTVNLISSTVSGNSAAVGSGTNRGGGGIFSSSGTVTLNSSTVSENSVTSISNNGGGVVITGGELILKNTIIAGNFLQDSLERTDCSLEGEAFITSQGHNLIGDDSVIDADFNCTFAHEAGDQVGTSENPIDAMLIALANNGGPTETHALLSGSPAIDAGSCGGATLDQRGQPRPVDIPALSDEDDGCDIGALEAQFSVTTSITDGDVGGLYDTLVLTNSAFGLSTIQLAEDGNYVLEDGEFLVRAEVLVEGNGATIERSTDEGTPEFRILHVAPTGDLTLNDITISNGLVTDESADPDDGGGGIWNEGGLLSINDSTISGNTALEGGGIFNDVGTLELIGSTVTKNVAGSSTHDGFGGGIFSNGVSMTIIDSTISENEANSGTGGIISSGMLEMTNSTVSKNLLGGLSVDSDGNATVIHSTIINNPEGSGIMGVGTITLANTIVAHHSSESSNDCQFVNNLTSNGFNIDTDESCNLLHTNDLPLTVPFVGALLDNGGPTKTHALTKGSPAIDAIPPENCVDADGNELETDQRGVERPQGQGCDIGAVEAAPILIGDFDCDGFVTILDVILIMRLIINFPESPSTCGGL